MSRRSVLNGFPVLDAAALDADAISASSVLTMVDTLAYHIFWTGTPTGTFAVQVSPDGVSNWQTLPNFSVSASGSASDAIMTLQGIPFLYVRLKYTRASGTGTATAYAVGKGV